MDEIVQRVLRPRMEMGGLEPPSAPTPQPPMGLVAPGNIDLNVRPKVKNPDGSISTVSSMSFQDENGFEVLIPTISPDGRRMTDDQAIEHYYNTGQMLGVFRTPEAAVQFAGTLHNGQAQQYVK